MGMALLTHDRRWSCSGFGAQQYAGGLAEAWAGRGPQAGRLSGQSGWLGRTMLHLRKGGSRGLTARVGAAQGSSTGWLHGQQRKDEAVITRGEGGGVCGKGDAARV